MQTRKAWKQELMMSLFKREATYDAGVTMSNANAFGMSGYLFDPKWPDEIKNDKGSVTNYEHGNTQDITNQRVELTYTESECKPNTLAGLGMLILGAITSTQDAALASYKHKIIPVAHGTALPSMQVEHLKGSLQYAYKGVKGNTLTLSGEAGGYVKLIATLIGSGTRVTSATAMAAKISESWMKISNCKVWMETGANILTTIDAPLVQGSENISSGTPDILHPRLKSFEWMWNNNLKPQDGFGGGGVYTDCDYGRRMQDLKFTMLFNDATEIDYFTAQNPCAIEFDLKGAIVVATSVNYFGFHLVIPRFHIKETPLPVGDVDDELTAEFICNCEEDGTNPAVILEVYSAQASYLAA